MRTEDHTPQAGCPRERAGALRSAPVIWPDPSRLDTSLDSRAVTFENPTGARGAGGAALGGRKGAPSRGIRPGERMVLADIDGPGTIRHFWCTVPPAPPPDLRALTLDVLYDGLDAPSISVPLLDFFGAPLGRPVAYASLLTVVAEGRGFNAYFPMPFHEHVRVDLSNHSSRYVECYFQIDYTVQSALPGDAAYLHASFGRANPTTMQDDFVITEGLRGPGRFLGCVVGVRPIDAGMWYGEGEVKIYVDGDRALPTICGTGLEDYVGSAWGMGPHFGPYAGAPLDVRAPGTAADAIPDFVGFYRWHLPDPVVFADELRVTIQQIGAVITGTQDATRNPPAGRGNLGPITIVERVDDYCAAAFTYCRTPQPVPPLDVDAATADLERRSYEPAHPMESFFAPA
jgi:hypothetical protein